jgi:hypothetical protein
MGKPCAKFNPSNPHATKDQKQEWLDAFKSKLLLDSCLKDNCSDKCKDGTGAEGCTECLTDNTCSDVLQCDKCGRVTGEDSDFSKIFGCTIDEDEGLSAGWQLAIFFIVVLALGFFFYRYVYRA